MSEYICRICSSSKFRDFCNLDSTPLANSYQRSKPLSLGSKKYKLNAIYCQKCWLVQLDVVARPKYIFSEYSYFSSYSKYWLIHCKKLFKTVEKNISISSNDLIVEIASNDGYLLKNFKNKYSNILGIEPARNVARIANKNNIKTLNKFFTYSLSKKLIQEYSKSKLIISLNVLAHVPNINDFVKGIKNLLQDDGTWVIEFPHLLNLIKHIQFDTIYHEHFSYLSIMSIQYLFDQHDLSIYDCERIPTHGGSLRVYVSHKERFNKTRRFRNVLSDEYKNNLNKNTPYKNFFRLTEKKRMRINNFFNKYKNKIIYAFGAPAKATTLFNFCRLNSENIKKIIDSSPHKQNKYIPGTDIFITDKSILKKETPDIIIILPWNLEKEIYPLLRNKLNYKKRIVSINKL